MPDYHRVIPTVCIQGTLWTPLKIRWIGTKLLKRSIHTHQTFLSKFFLWLMFKNKRMNKTKQIKKQKKKQKKKSFLNIFNFLKNKLFCFTVVWKYVILWDWSNAGIKNMFWKSLLERFIILTSGYFKSPSIFMKTAKRSICFPNSRKSLLPFVNHDWTNDFGSKRFSCEVPGVPPAHWNTDSKSSHFGPELPIAARG